MENGILIVLIGAILGLAAGYVFRAKKKGKKCIGCPYSDDCGGNCGQGCDYNKKSDG